MELQASLDLFSTALFPEDVFGEIQETELQKVYKKLLVDVHEDRFIHKEEKKKAAKAAGLLSLWLQKAQEKFKAGTYGNKNALNITITSKLGAYVVQEKLDEGDICTIYRGVDGKNEPVLIKVCRTPKNNDLVKNEAIILQHLWNPKGNAIKHKTLEFHIPRLIDSFELRDNRIKRMVNVTNFRPGFFTLKEVKAQHGLLDPRDLAWMMNRLLSALSVAHEAGVCHGAVVPTHFLINPTDHNGMLIDWSYATLNNAPIKAIVPAYKSLYAPELLKKLPSGPASDVYMVAMIVLLMCKKEGPNGERRHFLNFFKSFLYQNPKHRPDDTWKVFEDFGALLRMLYGKRAFRQFTMQKPKTK